MALKEQKVIMPSTLETIDTAFYDWVNETLDISATTNRGFNKVPLIWVSAERAFQVKHDKNLRDDFGVLKLPLISVERTSVVKDPTRKGSFQANVFPTDKTKGGSISYARRINQTKTGDFANADAYRTRPRFYSQGNGFWTRELPLSK